MVGQPKLAQIEPEEFIRLEQFANQQLLVSVMRVLCDISPQPNMARQLLALRFEALATRFEIGGNFEDEKLIAMREYMLNHGLELIGQLKPGD